MREIGLFDPNEGDLSPETRELVGKVNGNLMRVRAEYLRNVLVTWDMPERLMLEILQARLKLDKDLANAWYQRIYEEGGPSERTLRNYLLEVLTYEVARRVDPRIREILLLLDQGIERGSLPRGPATFHPGQPPSHKRWRAAREAKAAAAREASSAADVTSAS
jgi:hypothetical protein